VKAATHLVESAPLLSHPGKHLLDDPGLLEVDLKACLSTPFLFAHIPITVRSMTQDPHASFLGGMALASPAPFEELGPFVFGNDSLHLQEELIFRGLSEWSVEENHLHPMLGQLLQEQNLVGVVASEAVGTMHVDAIQPSGCGHIA
jgi:hypothetical protein